MEAVTLPTYTIFCRLGSVDSSSLLKKDLSPLQSKNKKRGEGIKVKRNNVYTCY
jgi:hypothetical protein